MSRRLLISWLQAPSGVILEVKKIKFVTATTSSPCICHEVMGTDDIIFVFFLKLSFKPAFSLFYFTFIKRLFNSSLSAIRVVSSAYPRLLIFLLAILISACDSPIRDQTCGPCLVRWILNHWNTCKVLRQGLLGDFFFFNWRLITLQYCSDFCHTLTWISHGCTL